MFDAHVPANVDLEVSICPRKRDAGNLINGGSCISICKRRQCPNGSNATAVMKADVRSDAYGGTEKQKEDNFARPFHETQAAAVSLPSQIPFARPISRFKCYADIEAITEIVEPQKFVEFSRLDGVAAWKQKNLYLPISVAKFFPPHPNLPSGILVIDCDVKKISSSTTGG